MFNNKFIYSSLVVILCFFFGAGYIEAATVVMEIPQKNISVGDEFPVTLIITAVDQPVNAFEGILQYSDTVSYQSFDLRHTVNTLWVTPPKNNSSEIRFAGMIPTGFRGTINPFNPEVTMPGDMVTFIFKVKKPGTVTFSLHDTNVFAHDGKGTAISVPIVLGSVDVEESQSNSVLTINQSNRIGLWITLVIFSLCLLGGYIKIVRYLKKRLNNESSTT